MPILIWRRSACRAWVGFEECVARQIRFSYRQLLDALNVLASVKALYKWRTRARKADWEAIIGKCSLIAEAWKSGAAGLFEEDLPLLLEYQEVITILIGSHLCGYTLKSFSEQQGTDGPAKWFSKYDRGSVPVSFHNQFTY